MKSIFKAVAIVTVFSVLTRALGFCFRIFISRKLGAEGLGLYQMASSILGIFMTLISSGIPLTTAKLVSKYESNNQIHKRNKVVASAFVVGLVVAFSCSLIVITLKHMWNFVLTDNRAVEILIIMVPSIIFSAIYAVFRGALWGQNDYFNCGLTELVEQIIRFALTFIMLYSVTDCFVATKNSAIAFNITCLVSAILAVVIYFKKGRLSFKKGEYKNVINSALPVTGVRVANSMVQPLTTLIIPTMLVVSGYSKSQAVASLGIVMGMTFPMLFVPMTVIGSISMVLIPSISSMMSKNDYDTINQNITKSLQVSIFISMMFVPLYLSVGDLIGIVLYDNVMAGMLLQISAVCVLPITLCNLSGSILNALNMETKSFINYLLGSAVLLASLVVFTPLVGINSVVISFFLSMTIITLLNIRKIKQTVPHFNYNLVGLTMRYTLVTIPASLLGHFVSNIMLYIFNNFFAGLIGGTISIVATLIMIKIFNLYDISEFLNIIKKKKKNI
ncbi:MAG: oligosaccharide flippase family protein [Clostridia bacterium]|nr:oligosaccharide flippase family protein [Clostridia bacterium]